MGQTPHDALFKAVFEDPKIAAEHLAALLPAAVLRHLDLSQLKETRASFVDLELDEHHSDLLFEVPLSGQDALLFLLFEHQSTPSPFMALRLLRYMLRIWERWQLAHPGVRGLPPILPVVLYHGAARWNAGGRLSDLLLVDADARADLGPYVPDFEYLLQDLSACSDEEFAGTALRHVALLLLKHIRDRDLADKLPGWTGLLGEVLRSSGLEGLRLVLQYLLEASESIGQADLVRLARRAERGPREAIMTLAEKLREEGRQEMRGLAEKLREEGVSEGQRKMLLKLLGLRFGPLPEEAEARVRAASTEELSRWAERVLRAESLEEVLL